MENNLVKYNSIYNVDFYLSEIDQVYDNVQKYPCYDNRQYNPLYTHQFTYEDLNNMNEDTINKLYLLYRIEDPGYPGGKLLRFFKEDESSNREGRIFRFPIKKFYEANLDLTKVKNITII